MGSFRCPLTAASQNVEEIHDRDDSRTSRISKGEMGDMPPLINIVVLALLVGGLLYFVVYKELRGRGILPGQKNLLKTGESTRARVIEASPTGNFFGTSGNTHDLQEIALVLEVHATGKEAYTVKTTRAIPYRGGSNPFSTGRELEVKIDRSNPKNIAIVGFDG
jgi:hypothetical protein